MELFFFLPKRGSQFGFCEEILGVLQIQAFPLSFAFSRSLQKTSLLWLSLLSDERSSDLKRLETLDNFIQLSWACTAEFSSDSSPCDATQRCMHWFLIQGWNCFSVCRAIKGNVTQIYMEWYEDIDHMCASQQMLSMACLLHDCWFSVTSFACSRWSVVTLRQRTPSSGPKLNVTISNIENAVDKEESHHTFPCFFSSLESIS